jgi:hypothetical protein
MFDVRSAAVRFIIYRQRRQNILLVDVIEALT